MPSKIGGGVNRQGNSYTNYDNGGYGYNNKGSTWESCRGPQGGATTYYKPSGNGDANFFRNPGQGRDLECF